MTSGFVLPGPREDPAREVGLADVTGIWYSLSVNHLLFRSPCALLARSGVHLAVELHAKARQ